MENIGLTNFHKSTSGTRLDETRRRAQEHERKQLEEKNALDRVWDFMEGRFIQQVRDYYRSEMSKNIEGWSSAKIGKTIEKWESDVKQQIIEDINPRRMPSIDSKLSQKELNTLDEINPQKKNDFEEHLKQRVDMIWTNHNLHMRIIHEEIPHVLANCKAEAENRERYQRIQNAIDQGWERLDNAALGLLRQGLRRADTSG